MKAPGWFYVWTAIALVFWTVVAVVAYHFITKWW
jgi:hypothetical protein